MHKKNVESYPNINTVGAIVACANSLKRKGHYNEAEKKYDNAIKLDPKYSYAYFDLADLLVRLHRYEDAVDSFKKGLEFNQEDPKAFNYLGYILGVLERYHEAKELFEKAIELDPNFSEAYWNLSRVVRTYATGDVAIDYIKTAVKLNPMDHRYWQTWFEVLNDISDSATRKRELNKFVSMHKRFFN